MAFTIFVALFCAFNVALAKDSSRIIGGQRAKQNQFPYQVSLLTSTSKMCGGSIISDKVILTAAHCTKGLPQNGLTVFAGSIQFGGSAGIKSKSYKVHEKYDSNSKDFDISVIFLEKSLSFGPGIKKIELANSSDKIADDAVGVVSGYGVIDAQKTSAPQLLYVNVPVRSKAVCNKFFRMTDNMICAGIENGQKSSCPGDSGGPLVVNGKLVGIVSFGPGCGSAAPAVYANVANLRDWVKKTAGF